MGYSLNAVEGIDKLRDRLNDAETVEDYSFILSDYIQSGNKKISKTTAIFNMNSAHDCPNFGTKENGESDTGFCQVPKEACYAAKAENIYKTPLDYRRRQEYLWDSIPPELWAKAFQSLNSRKRNTFDSIRFSEAGDFRSDEDIRRVNVIAQIVDIPIYTYSASHKLDWSIAEHFTVNASNDRAEYGDRRYVAVEDVSDIPNDGMLCPHDAGKMNGVDEPVSCGDCTACIDSGESQPRDVYIRIH